MSEYRWLLDAIKAYLLGETDHTRLDGELAAFGHNDTSDEARAWGMPVSQLYLLTTEVGEGLREEGDLLVTARAVYRAMAEMYRHPAAFGLG